MYENHFALTKPPFSASAEGQDVFVGPQIVTAMTGIRRTLATSDAIAAISGPVGSGKTTLVLKVLETSEADAKVAHLGRVQLQSEDALEWLLEELGVEPLPRGPMRRFSAFRNALQTLEESGARLIIVVEDYARLGVETLAELEVLTAADSGPSRGAAIILLGDDGLLEHLRHPALLRTQQRTRQHLVTATMKAAEVRGYLRHCFRGAGREFEEIFDTDAADLLTQLSDGVVRVVNNIVEATLSLAAEQELDSIPSSLIAQVATDEFGLDAPDFEFTAESAEDSSLEIPAMVAADLEALPVEELAAEESEAIDIEDAATEEPVEDETDTTMAEESEFERNVEPESEPAKEVIVEDIPVLAAATEPEPTPEETEFTQDPTINELLPDIAELEAALASQEFNVDQISDVAEQSSDEAAAADIPELIPEITLDAAIGGGIQNGGFTPASKSNDNQPAQLSESSDETPEVNIPDRDQGKADAELDNITSGLAMAKSLDDIDAKMAETLFGEELSIAASQLLPPAAAGTPIAAGAVDPQKTVRNEVTSAKDEPTTEAVSEPADDFSNPISVTLENTAQRFTSSDNQTASQRLKTVRALNADQSRPTHPIPAPSALHKNGSDATTEPSSGESIEDQIDVSMSQTFEALNLRRPTVVDDDVENDANDNDDDDDKRGFFSRFKRS